MSNNRVEQLESTVAELESTVDGLTSELIEAKERIRVLEAELDEETPTRVPDRRNGESESADKSDGTSEAAPDDVAEAAADADDGAGDEAEDSGTDDIIVA
ncbi:hypothetical protein EA462_00490 [Natrarchaeobius halalkaliphilus]|uniref:Chromosome segregation protein SMC n=1 Tax=Natrarchaeobius halalkaliphilus TaxID=1679091 RepID=A0A3N6P940_9EURY|nr:hypothetical protein [Natrarchaeobius halalkaliphilus]RQG92745.1 hypothetical protein EA462_00490 [Natrarchaeobius halalkaliphilus]